MNISESAQRFWRGRSAREQWFLRLVTGFLLICVLGVVLWPAATDGRARLSQRNAQLEAQLGMLHIMGEQAAELRRNAKTALPLEQMRPSLSALLATRNLKPRVMDSQDGALQIRLELECPFETCLDFLDAVRSESHWTLSRVRFESTPQAGQVRAQLLWSHP